MNNITTLGETFERVQRQHKNTSDETIPIRDVSFNSLNSISIGNEQHPLKDEAARQISTRLSTPYSYLSRCPADIQAQNLNHWLKYERNDELFIRFDGDKVRAIFTPRYVPFDNFSIIEQLFNIGFNPDTAVQLHLDNRLMLLNIMNKENEFCVGKDDRMMAGISISNSEIGLSSVSVSQMTYRLVCTNGLITVDRQNNSKYRHISDRPKEIFPELIANASQNADEQKRQLTISLESPVADPQATLDQFNKNYVLNEKEKDAVKWAWPYEEGNSMFNIVQTYTKAAQHPPLTADSALRLQRSGGNILALVS